MSNVPRGAFAPPECVLSDAPCMVRRLDVSFQSLAFQFRLAMMLCPCLCCSFEGHAWAIRGPFSMSGALHSCLTICCVVRVTFSGALCASELRLIVHF